MPNFTEIPKEFRKEYAKKFINLDLDKVSELAENDPVIFAYFYLGITLRLHQAFIIHLLLTAEPKTEEIGPRIGMCVARQLGKSLAFCVFALWSCFYNKYPSTIFNITIIYLTSRDDDAAGDITKKIRQLMEAGNRNMVKYSGISDYFTGSLKEPNNKHEITFLNDAYIGSFPPTLTSLGKSSSWFFVDEAHRLNCTDTDPDTFFDVASPMVAETRGGICLSSSAQGTTGFFYRAIDPDKRYPNNEYTSIWWSHEIWDDETYDCKSHKAYVESERIRLTEAGRFKFWQQEHMSLFTVTETSFFEHTDIDVAIKDTSQLYEWHDSPCSLGIDYGLKTSRTVLTIRTKIKDEIIQLFQYRCPANFDINNLVNPAWEHSIQKLKERYNLFLIIVDDSPPGDTINRWLESNSGIQVKKYNFRSDQMSKTDGLNRNCVAYSYRAKLKEGILKIPKWNTIQQYEMKQVHETEQKVLISIKAPEGQLCDTFDSDMMACIPFLDMQTVIDFQVDIPLSEEDKPQNKGRGYDYFHSPTEEEMLEMIKQANEKML